MSYLTTLARCFSKEEKQIEWLTPSNFLVRQNYLKVKRKKIKTQMGHSTIRLTLQEDIDELDKRRTVRSFPSNFVHSLDAANVHLALEKAKSRGIDQVCTIHDCYGAVAGQIEDFVTCAKESFVEIYQNNVLDDLYDQASTQLDDPSKLPAPLEMGDFDIKEVMSAPYVFS
jgi:DNA-directed RNA polymerase